MTAELAARAGGPAEYGGVEVEYAYPERGCKRRPPAALLVLAVRAGQPGAGLCGIPGPAERESYAQIGRDAPALTPGHQAADVLPSACGIRACLVGKVVHDFGRSPD